MKLKKVATGFLAVVLGIGITAGAALAAPSVNGSDVTVVNNSADGDQYTVTDLTEASSFATIEAETPDLAEALKAVNAALDTGNITETLEEQLQKIADNTNLPDTIRESAQTILATIQDKKEALTDIFDLDRTGEGVEKTDDGKYKVTLKVPTLTTSTTGIVVLHYSTVKKAFELITPESTDLANQEITVVFDDLSPVMILCDKSTGNGTAKISSAGTTTASTTASTGSSSAKSPKTEDTTGIWLGFAAAAAVFAGAAVMMLRKKKA